MVIAQGDIFWADLPVPYGSEPGYRRPVVVVQHDSFNRSRLNTIVCVIITGQLRRAGYPGNVLLPANATGLPQDSVANVTQIATVDKARFEERTGRLDARLVGLVLQGVERVIARPER